MENWWSGLLRCPLCHAEMARDRKSFFCGGERRHCFDLAAQGYVNMASSRAAGGGDDATLIAARVDFLGKGHYQPIAQKLGQLLARHAPGGIVVDAGCGEGYYTNALAREHSIFGFDLSKNGVKHAAKQGVREANRALFAVSGIFDMPLADESVDAVISLFAPVASEEFLRVLKPGGVLILAGAGREHLFSLKSAIYDTPYYNRERADAPDNMTLVEKEILRFDMALGQSDLQSLFAMTPYFYRTSVQGKERLAALESLVVNAEVEFAVYRK